MLAFRYLPLADAHAVAATSPLIVIALGVLFLGERAGAGALAGRRRGLRGRAADRASGLPRRSTGRCCCRCSAPCCGPAIRSWCGCARARTSADTTLVWSAFAAFAATTLVAPFDWQWPDAFSGTLLIATALLGALAHYALIKALDYAEAGAVQPYSYTLLVWVTILGVVVFGDIPDGWTLAGAAIIVASGLYTWHHDRRLGTKRHAGDAPSSGATSSCRRRDARARVARLRSDG